MASTAGAQAAAIFLCDGKRILAEARYPPEPQAPELHEELVRTVREVCASSTLPLLAAPTRIVDGFSVRVYPLSTGKRLYGAACLLWPAGDPPRTSKGTR